ncbi:sister chromatid cohesion protein Dcc1 [Mycena sp. CBHHK59/15]|nr:sister chromatid cohesion protein Dcc1 [Mycena sp. CBHHK59/15]
MTELDIRFSTSLTDDAGSFKLLELPSGLCKLIEAAVESLTPLRLSIKGHSGEDAVLCTNDATYTIRSVVLSNSILVVMPQLPTSSDTVVIRDQVNEILELTPSVPKIHKLSSLLRGREYDDMHENDDDEGLSLRQGRKGLTCAAAKAEIQASEVELERGLRQQRVLNVNGELRPIAPGYLTSILESILNFLASQSLLYQAVPAEELSSTLADENEISRSVSTQIMFWFGEVYESTWSMDVDSVLKEIGLGILRHHKDDPIEKDTLLAKWKLVVGDTFEASVSLTLLSGNYLMSTAPMTGNEMLTYFPSTALPVDPPSRFIDLFLTRPRWKAEDIAPFLSDIAINTKDRDKLLLKFTRATTDTQGLWYTKK